MPIIVRLISQAVFLFVSALLAFVGIAPDVSIPDEEEARQATEERKRVIREILFEEEDIRPEATIPIISIDDSKLNLTPTPKQQTEVPSLPPFPTQSPIVEEEPDPIIVTKPEQEKTLPSTINNVVLNIICSHRDGNKISVSTGSGVLISEKGVVITNAHVAQLFLLKNYTRKGYMDCSLKRENIPTIGYRADLLYISKDWLNDNAHLISSPSPRGTGENDYALLVITESTNPAIALPEEFPAATMNLNEYAAEERDTVTVAGYPGNQASFFDLTSNSRLAIDSTTITDVYTFDRVTTDVFSTTENSVAIKGSSGGGVFEDNELVGIIATTGGQIGHSFINAITLSYITRDIRVETGESLLSWLSGDVKEKAQQFKTNEVPSLISLISRYL